MEKELLLKTFRNTIIAAVYVFIVSQIMVNGNAWFGHVSDVIGPFVVLMLFCLSAAVVGGLVFGETIWLFMNNKKQKSVKAAFYSVGWLGVYTVLGLIFLAAIN